MKLVIREQSMEDSPVLYSVKIKLKIDTTKTKTVIEDTLTRIRAIPGVTVVRSTEDTILSTDFYKIDFITLKFAYGGTAPRSQTREILKKIRSFPLVLGAYAIRTSLTKII